MFIYLHGRRTLQIECFEPRLSFLLRAIFGGILLPGMLRELLTAGSP